MSSTENGIFVRRDSDLCLNRGSRITIHNGEQTPQMLWANHKMWANSHIITIIQRFYQQYKHRDWTTQSLINDGPRNYETQSEMTLSKRSVNESIVALYSFLVYGRDINFIADIYRHMHRTMSIVWTPKKYKLGISLGHSPLFEPVMKTTSF